MVEKTLIVIDESLRLLFARLEGALGLFFRQSEVERVFSDARDNQVDGKEYSFIESPRIRVTGYVEEYEPDTIEISNRRTASTCKTLWPVPH